MFAGIVSELLIVGLIYYSGWLICWVIIAGGHTYAAWSRQRERRHEPERERVALSWDRERAERLGK